MIKKLLHKLRMWLLDLLDGIPSEKYAEKATATKREIDVLNTYLKELDCLILRYKFAVQEICRRSDDSYYDWCCDYCRMTCDKRNGWCKHFSPDNILRVGVKEGI